MPIELFLADASVTPIEPAAYILASVLTFAALGGAWAMGVFRTRSIVGPTRLGTKDSVTLMLVVLGMTVVTWATAPALVAKAMNIELYEKNSTTQPTTQAGDAPGAPAPVTPAPAKFRPEALVTLGAVGAAAAIIMCVLMTVAYRPGAITRMGFGPTDLLQAPLSGLAAGMLAVPLVTAVSIYTAGLWDLLGLGHPNEHPLLQILGDPSRQGLRNLILFTAVVLAPVAEELIFRGYVQTLLVRLVGGNKPSRAVFARWTAILLTALLFSLVHEWWTRPPIFALAVCIGYLYERTGNLWACVILHAIFNATSTALFLLQQQNG